MTMDYGTKAAMKTHPAHDHHAQRTQVLAFALLVGQTIVCNFFHTPFISNESSSSGRFCSTRLVVSSAVVSAAAALVASAAALDERDSTVDQ